MSVWDELRVELLRLERGDPSPLLTRPTLRGEDDLPPYHVTLQPWAVSIAEALHDRFHNQLRLRVGALPFPPSSDTSTGAVDPHDAPALGLPEGLTVQLSAPLQVRSGELARTAVLVSNATGAEVVVETSGRLIAHVVDPFTEMCIGGFTGWLTSPLVRFTVADGGSTEIPLLVGTASFIPDLGYAVPPGEWALTVDLALADGREVRSQAMEFHIIN